MKVREPVDDQGRELAPFERPVVWWKAMGAPVDLWDVEAACAAELARGAGTILRAGEPGSPGPVAFYADRWWRRHRPAFLAELGELTPRERAIVASRRPARERPGP